MPQIPDYASRVGLPTETGAVKIPEGVASDPWEALAKGAAVASHVGFEVSERLNRADQVRQVSEASADASVALNDMRNQWLQSPDFNIKPEATFDNYRRTIVDSGKAMAENITNPQARAVFEDHYRKLAASHINQGTDDTRRKRLDIIGAGTLSSVDKFQNAAASAPDEMGFHENIKGIRSTLAGAMASGAITYEQGERIRENAEKSAIISRAHLGLVSNPAELQRQLDAKEGIWAKLPESERAQLMETAQNRAYTFDQRAKAEAKEKAVTDGYAYVYNTFHLDNPDADFDGAIRWLQNPENAAKVGLSDPMTAAQVANNVHVQRQHALASKDQAEKVKVDQFNNDALNRLATGKLTVPDVLKADVPGNVKEHWIGNIDRQSRGEEREDPEVFNGLVARMYSDDPAEKITDFSQVIPYIGKGISGRAGQTLKTYLDQAQEPPKSAYFTMAKQDFLARNANDPEMKAMYPQFMNLLSQHVKAEGLKGEQIWTKAQELQKTVEEVRWYHKIIPSLAPKPVWQTVLESRSKTGESLQDADPVATRIEHLKAGGMPDAKIAEFLRSPDINIDPTKYGLK